MSTFPINPSPESTPVPEEPLEEETAPDPDVDDTDE